jgi:hypothetical protein
MGICRAKLGKLRYPLAEEKEQVKMAMGTDCYFLDLSPLLRRYHRKVVVLLC